MNTVSVTSRSSKQTYPVHLVDDHDHDHDHDHDDDDDDGDGDGDGDGAYAYAYAYAYVVRRALQLLLQTLDIPVRTCADPRAFLIDLPSLIPGCLVLDIRMPVISGWRLQQQLRDRSIGWPVIISGHGDIEACRDAFRQGGIDFLSKPVDEQDLIDAVQKAVAALDQEQQRAAEVGESRHALNTLTTREREVLDFIVRGFTNGECAGVLGVSPRTVETHRANLAGKLGTHSVVERLVSRMRGQFHLDNAVEGGVGASIRRPSLTQPGPGVAQGWPRGGPL